jgi:hypothetical protein
MRRTSRREEEKLAGVKAGPGGSAADTGKPDDPYDVFVFPDRAPEAARG